MATPRVYVTQYGYWWSISLPAWRQFVARQVAEGARGYELSREHGFHALARRPTSVSVISARHERTAYWSPSRIVRPLDWDIDDWAAELAELE